MGYAESDPRTRGPVSPRSGRVSRSSGGWRAATSRSTFAGRYPPTRSRCNGSRRNSSRYSPTSFFRTLPRQRSRCSNKHVPSPSFSRPFPIRSEAASSRALRGQAATSPASPVLSRRCPANGWSCSRRLRRASRGSPSCSTLYRHRMPEFFLNPLKAAAHSTRVEAIAAPVRDTSELESVVAALARGPNSGLIATPDSFVDVHRAEVTSLAARYHIPAVYPFRQFPEGRWPAILRKSPVLAARREAERAPRPSAGQV
jgi:hypothetical protein